MIKRNSDIIVLAILWIVSIYSIIASLSLSYELGLQNYIGYGLLIIISVLRLLKIKKLKTVLVVVLILGSTNAIQFTYNTVTFFVNWTPNGNSLISLGVQPLSILLLIFFIITNFSAVRNFFEDIFGEDPSAELEMKRKIDQQTYEELIDSDDRILQEIIEDKDSFTNEYFKAARRILIERGKYKK